MKVIRIVLPAFLLLIAVTNVNAQTQKELDAGEFQKGIAAGDSIQLLDVRTPGEYESGHIKNALLADWKDTKEFDRRVAFIDKDKPVYVYCLAGSRSAAAAAKMRDMGYKNVYELRGGINAWKSENKPVEGKADVKQMPVADFEKAVNAKGYVLVDIGAEWCPPCKKMQPVIESLKKNNAGKFALLEVDGGRDEDILRKYQVTTLPVFLLFRDGRQVWRRDGVAEEKEIADLLK